MSAAGAGLILLSCLLFAKSFVRERRQRLEELRDMDAALESLYAELSLRQTSLPELAAFLAEHAHGSASAFFRELEARLSKLGETAFFELWRETTETLTRFGSEEKNALLRLGGSLGRYALEEQLRAVAECRARLARSILLCAESIKDQRRLSYGLALAAGGMICIMLF